METRYYHFKTFRVKVLLLVIGILVASTCAVMLFTSMEVKKTMHEKSNEEARNQLHLVKLNIESEYQSILYHKEYALQRYKEQLKNLTSILVSYLDIIYSLYEKGVFSEEQAKNLISETVRNFKYGNDDYFLMYDLDGVVISHPDKHIMHKNRSHFQDVNGNYVVRSFIDIARNKGSGFYSYWFPRKADTMRKKPVEKLCYVELYKKWNWVVGTGVYIDDIERDAKEKLDRVIVELKDAFDKITIGKTGYFFLFTDQKKMLIHRTLGGQDLSDFKNPVQKDSYLDGLMSTSKNPNLPYVYLWDKPPDHKGDFRFWKESYVTYFQPLGWYIASSVYRDEMEEPAKKIIHWQAVLNIVILVFSILLALLLVRKMTGRLKLLTSYAQQLSSSDFSLLSEISSNMKGISAKSWDEIGRLARTFAYMIQSLIDYIDRLKETTAVKEKIESELRIAHDIQMSILPKIFPPFPSRNEFDIYATIKPAREVGGDFYDFFQIDHDHICFVIADVSGKGVPASLFMAVTKTLIKAKAGKETKPSEIVAKVNAELCQGNDTSMFVTIFCGILDSRTGETLYTNGGHNYPLVLRKGGEASFLKSTPGILVGAMDDASYATDKLILKPGESIFLYTDGVTEAMNIGGGLFSDERLKGILERLSEKPIKEIATGVGEEIEHFVSGAPQSDDITIMVIRYYGNEALNQHRGVVS